MIEGATRQAMEGVDEGYGWGDLKILAGTANPHLAGRIASELGLQVTDMEVRRFADGELDVKVRESMRGHDVFVVQPTCHPVNENLVELALILDALKRASARRVTAVLPYYGYARKEKKTQPREPISAKLVANVIALAGANRVMLLDLHTEAIEGFFDVPVDHLTAQKLLANYVRQKGLAQLVVVAPDVGSTRRARSMARLLDAPMAIIDKRRPRDDVMEVMHVIGDVAGLNAVVIDDMITTGGTVSSVAKALREKGSLSVHVAATHGVFTAVAAEQLLAAPIVEVVVTDSIPIPPGALGPKLTVLPVAPLLAECIRRVHQNRSVTELFW